MMGFPDSGFQAVLGVKFSQEPFISNQIFWLCFTAGLHLAALTSAGISDMAQKCSGLDPQRGALNHKPSSPKFPKPEPKIQTP